jgi:hypothetical protein
LGRNLAKILLPSQKKLDFVVKLYARTHTTLVVSAIPVTSTERLGQSIHMICVNNADDITLMMSHINSYNRKKLNNQSAHQLFSFLHGGDILDSLGIKFIPANEINLTPLLLKK